MRSKEFLYVFASVLLSLSCLSMRQLTFKIIVALDKCSENHTNTLTNIPIDAKYNDKTYFVSGLTSEVTVFLKGSNWSLLQAKCSRELGSFAVARIFVRPRKAPSEVPLIRRSFRWFDRNRRASKSFCKNRKKAKNVCGQATIPTIKLWGGITVSDTLETTM